jgi:protein kinase A
VLVFEMLSGLPPYHQPDANPVILYERILRGPRFLRWPPFRAPATDLNLRLMHGDPSRRRANLRAGAADVFAHAWFAEVDWERLVRRDITAPYLPKICGEGDASAFETYDEGNSAEAYGQETPDLFGHEFPEFDYTTGPSAALNASQIQDAMQSLTFEMS